MRHARTERDQAVVDVLLGPPGNKGRPLTARRVRASSVSRIGNLEGDRWDEDGEGGGGFLVRLFERAVAYARTNPRNILPVSPMKMEAGLKL